MICGVFLFFFVIGVVATVFWLTDFGDMFYRWQGRVHIGRWTSDEQWSNAVKKSVPALVEMHTLCAQDRPNKDDTLGYT